jgi:peroxiredoxin Q/BCP
MVIGEGKARDFELLDYDGKKVGLKDFKGKFVVLYFYPKDNTPGCTIEAINFSGLLGEFEKLGAVVLGVSPDSVQSHCKFRDKKELKIELLSDESKRCLEDWGVWGLKKFMGREYMGVIRSTFLINPKGEIVKVWSPVKVKGHAKAVLECLAGLVS